MSIKPKYVEKILNSEKEKGLTQEFLSKNGFQRGEITCLIL